MAKRERNQEDTTLPLWEKLGGGTMRLTNNYRVKPQERFRASEDMIPVGAQDQVRLIEEGTPTQDEQEEKEEIKQEQQEGHGEFYIEGRGGPWYDVKSSEGVPMNSKALKIAEAEELKNKLNNNEE
jgi:hypothetical protein